jgi:hypothetical protein
MAGKPNFVPKTTRVKKAASCDSTASQRRRQPKYRHHNKHVGKASRRKGQGKGRHA